MATANTLDRLRKVEVAIREVDRKSLFRSGLGTASLDIFQPTLDVIGRRLEFALANAEDVHDQQLGSVISTFENIRDQLMRQLARDDAQFLADRDHFIEAVGIQLEELKQYWPPLVAAAIASRGFLEDQGLQEQFQRSLAALRAEASFAVDEVRQQTEALLADARQLAQEIEKKARRTATKISVEEAQKQFGEASIDLGRAVKYWGLVSVVSLGAFVGVGLTLLFHELPSELTLPQGIYQTAVRIALLTAVGALSTFSLKVLRAQMHMRQHNIHRRRLANSMGAFVESAATPEQRDLILAHLVGAIASFGNSGLLAAADENDGPARLSVESITRILGSPGRD